MKLTASDIHVELGGNEILKGIDAAIKEKEFVGIIGPNGSGKSTLLKCIYRVLKPDTGVIMLDGKPLSEYKVCLLYTSIMSEKELLLAALNSCLPRKM